MKVCQCGASYDLDGWCSLPHPPTHRWRDGDGLHEMRTCAGCGSSIVVLVAEPVPSWIVLTTAGKPIERIAVDGRAIKDGGCFVRFPTPVSLVRFSSLSRREAEREALRLAEDDPRLFVTVEPRWSEKYEVEPAAAPLEQP